jgi:hypothetical protein
MCTNSSSQSAFYSSLEPLEWSWAYACDWLNLQAGACLTSEFTPFQVLMRSRWYLLSAAPPHRLQHLAYGALNERQPWWLFTVDY